MTPTLKQVPTHVASEPYSKLVETARGSCKRLWQHVLCSVRILGAPAILRQCVIQYVIALDEGTAIFQKSLIVVVRTLTCFKRVPARNELVDMGVQLPQQLDRPEQSFKWQQGNGVLL